MCSRVIKTIHVNFISMCFVYLCLNTTRVFFRRTRFLITFIVTSCIVVSMWCVCKSFFLHYIDVIMTTMASQITSLTVVYSTVYSDADQRKHQSSASLAFVWGIHRDRWIPRTKGQLRGNVSISWRHHANQIRNMLPRFEVTCQRLLQHWCLMI